ncbi:hypothetical protein [Citrobacter sedlakii]|uniref:hypothetical protein n=1 Tax=Citrobacter sedlakii TaxID=67826 RepID=UPI0020BFB468|nr:hypothetical protein [Citrobacter sedlakii]MCK8147089.1 hypothetical protein [Citrobacter sedlakii]
MKRMKIFPLFFLVPAFLLAGCGHRTQPEAPPVMLSASNSEAPGESITLSTIVMSVKKKPNISWKEALPEWEPQKGVLIFQGDAPVMHKRIAARRDVSITSIDLRSAVTTTSNSPVPVSAHRSSGTSDDVVPDDTVTDLMMLPAYRRETGTVTLRVSWNSKDAKGRFSASQFVSLQPGQSLLLSRLPDDDTQQVVIITPQIDHLSLPL